MHSSESGALLNVCVRPVVAASVLIVGAGMLLIALGPVPTDRRSQTVAGVLALLIVATSWIVALRV